MVEEACTVVTKKTDLPALSNVRFEVFEDGKEERCLYVGPYADEPPVFNALHAFIAEKDTLHK